MDELTVLISKAQEGDHKAYRQIYELFYKRIYRYCHINLYDEDAALDVCQETFVKAWRGLPNFRLDNGGSFQAFLFRIARNLIIDLSRKKKEAPLEHAEQVETNEDFIHDIDRSDEAIKLNQALERLSPEDKHLIILRYFEDLSYAEIAKTVGMNEGNVRVKTHRLLKKLKDILAEN